MKGIKPGSWPLLYLTVVSVFSGGSLLETQAALGRSIIFLPSQVIDVLNEFKDGQFITAIRI